MNREPERPIEKALRDYGRSRVEQAAPTEVHPATRAMLQAEVDRVITKPLAASSEEAVRNFARPFATTPHQPGWLARFWPRLAFAGTIAAAFTLVVTILRNDLSRPTRTTSDSSSMTEAKSEGARLADRIAAPPANDALGRAPGSGGVPAADSLRAGEQQAASAAQDKQMFFVETERLARPGSKGGDSRGRAEANERGGVKLTAAGERIQTAKEPKLVKETADKPSSELRAPTAAPMGGAPAGGAGFGGFGGSSRDSGGVAGRGTGLARSDDGVTRQLPARGVSAQPPPSASGPGPAQVPALAVSSQPDAGKSATSSRSIAPTATAAPKPAASRPAPAERAELAGLKGSFGSPTSAGKPTERTIESVAVEARLFGLTPPKSSLPPTAPQSSPSQRVPLDAFQPSASVQQHFSQEHARRELRRNFLSPPLPPVLESFRFERDGDRVTITDADGSKYAGTVVRATLGEVEDLAAQGVETAAKLRELSEVQKAGERPVPAPDVGLRLEREEAARFGSAPTAWFFFEAAGTNRTLNQPVVFNGSYYATDPGSQDLTRLGAASNRLAIQLGQRLKVTTDTAEKSPAARFSVAGAAPAVNTSLALAYKAGASATNAPTTNSLRLGDQLQESLGAPVTSRVKGTAIIGKDRLEINATPRK